MSGIVCIKQGVEETPNKEDKEGPPKDPRSPGVALVQQGGKEKSDGANTTMGTTKKRGIRMNRQVKPIV